MNLTGLHVPSLERDACGIGCVVKITGDKSYEIIDDAINMLENMEHRGATGSDPTTGDGAGILIQIPHLLFSKEAEKLSLNLPEAGKYGVGMFFFPSEPHIKEECKKVFASHADELQLKILGYRKVPVDQQIPGQAAKDAQPSIEQVFVSSADPQLDQDTLERKLYVLRNYTTHFIGHYVPGNNGRFYAASLSSRVIVYKGQLRTDQVRPFYYDLQDSNTRSSMAMVHSRFSTNTFPNWKLAQPFRFIAHNGEINTIRGNVNKMKSKEALMRSELFSETEMKMLLPVTDANHSDSANLDALVELLTLSGRPLAHVMMMLVPEAWQDNKSMDQSRKAFYKYHASLMEPWDGPAALFFTDGKQIGATLDRNGLRPARYCITKDEKLIMASEAGVIHVEPTDVIRKGRLGPGKMLIADLVNHTIYDDDEIKKQICEDKPYFDWIVENRIKLRLLPEKRLEEVLYSREELLIRQKAYGYTSEDIKLILKPMAEKAVEPVGSMGADAPLAVLSKRSQHISSYFKQFFAQVSNPPIDPIRERMVMSLFTRLGESLNILEESASHTKQIHVSHPILDHNDLAKLQSLEEQGFRYHTIQCLFKPSKNENLEKAIDKICAEAEQAVLSGKNLLILSNRQISEEMAPVPSLITTGAVHHHLVRKNLRTRAGLVVEAGDAWETHHFATIIGYGASAVYPFIAMQTIKQLYEDKGEKEQDEAIANYQQAIGYGLLKVMSKMGISTLQSYQSAQIFECIGLGNSIINKCFKGTISRISGLGFQDIAREIIAPFRFAFPEADTHQKPLLDVGGFYQWKRRGEKHLLSPEVIHLLQKSTSLNNYETYKKYARIINRQKDQITLRSCLTYKKLRKPAPIDEVEPEEAIMKRFATGAMSFGSLSHEAHSTLAIAMNRIGAKSNSGEGGEDEVRYQRSPNGDSQRSAIKQVASGRFGVTSNYLTNADEIQIKMAQGAKPGEGGQLPGHKVDEWIGRVRHSTPG
ncbi:MAG: glutamate synthase large subunit, partial [Cyclobacteriaceae bacterium]